MANYCCNLDCIFQGTRKKTQLKTKNMVLTCAVVFLRTGPCQFPNMLAGSNCLLGGEVGAGISATKRFSLNGRVSASPAASSSWQHTQALALQQAQWRRVLQWRQLLGHKGESAARRTKQEFTCFFSLPPFRKGSLFETVLYGCSILNPLCQPKTIAKDWH